LPWGSRNKRSVEGLLASLAHGGGGGGERKKGDSFLILADREKDQRGKGVVHHELCVEKGTRRWQQNRTREKEQMGAVGYFTRVAKKGIPSELQFRGNQGEHSLKPPALPGGKRRNQNSVPQKGGKKVKGGRAIYSSRSRKIRKERSIRGKKKSFPSTLYLALKRKIRRGVRQKGSSLFIEKLKKVGSPLLGKWERRILLQTFIHLCAQWGGEEVGGLGSPSVWGEEES